MISETVLTLALKCGGSNATGWLIYGKVRMVISTEAEKLDRSQNGVLPVLKLGSISKNPMTATFFSSSNYLKINKIFKNRVMLILQVFIGQTTFSFMVFLFVKLGPNDVEIL